MPRKYNLEFGGDITKWGETIERTYNQNIFYEDEFELPQGLYKLRHTLGKSNNIKEENNQKMIKMVSKAKIVDPFVTKLHNFCRNKKAVLTSISTSVRLIVGNCFPCIFSMFFKYTNEAF